MACRLLTNMKKTKGTEKAVNFMLNNNIWTALICCYVMAKRMNTEKNMEHLDEIKDTISDGEYLTRCNRQKLAHTLSKDFCCIECLDEEFVIKD